MQSSYEKNNFGMILRALVLGHKPQMVVECGVLNGYSTFHIAHALRFNRIKRNIGSVFLAYDLFEDYEYNHGYQDMVEQQLKAQGLHFDCNVIKMDAFKVYDEYEDGSIDFLHFDISNDGDILLKMLDTWGHKINENGMIAFEGGSKERDDGWIKKYNKKPIRPELINNPVIYKNWDIQIMDLYPSLTLMWRKN